MYSVNTGSFDIRKDMNRVAIDLILQNPFIGMGYGQTRHLFADILGKDVGLHNSFLFEFLSVGIIFGSVYICIFIYLITKLFHLAYNKTNHVYIKSVSLPLFSGFVFAVVELNGFAGFFVEILAVMIALVARLSNWNKHYSF